MGLLTLQDRREREDLIIVKGKDRTDIVIMVANETKHTRRHSRKIEKSQCSGDVKKFSFPHRTVDVWNGLNEEIVEADSMHTFKNKLDKFRNGDRI